MSDTLLESNFSTALFHSGYKVSESSKLEAWELFLATMRLHEVSSFKVKPLYSAVYPAVAKTLRDSFDKYD